MEDPQTRVWTTQKEKNDHTGEIEQALPWAGLPGGTNGKKNLPANAGDMREVGSIPGLGRSPGGGHGSPLQYSCLENPMERGAWQATVHRVAESDMPEVT